MLYFQIGNHTKVYEAKEKTTKEAILRAEIAFFTDAKNDKSLLEFRELAGNAACWKENGTI